MAASVNSGASRIISGLIRSLASGISTAATIRINAETYARLRAGELDPQDAFLAGQVELEGDEGMAIELALTALSPD